MAQEEIAMGEGPMVEVLSPMVKDLLNKLHYSLSTEEVTTKTIESLNDLKVNAVKMLNEISINSMNSKFKKDLIRLVYDNSLAYVDISKLNQALDKVEQNEKFKNIVNFVLMLSPFIDISQGSSYIDFNFYLPYKYENETHMLKFAKLSYIENDTLKEDLLMYIGSYSHPVIKVSLFNEKENNKNTIEDQLKGLVYLLDTYIDKIKDLLDDP